MSRSHVGMTGLDLVLEDDLELLETLSSTLEAGT